MDAVALFAWSRPLLSGPLVATEVAVRDGPSLGGGTAVAVAFEDATAALFVVPALGGYDAHVALQALVAGAAAAAAAAHAFVAPAAVDTGREDAPEADAYWSTYGGGDAARIYRDHVDALILRAVADLEGPIRAVSELCGGDGSLAVKLSAALPAASSYVVYERNATLAAAAEARGVTVVRGDVDDLAFGPQKSDLWVASGSVLCSHVGARRACPAMLAKLRDALAENGRLVVTGWTSTFLTPKLLVDAGLVVDRGSVPVPEAAPFLETAFGRFHLWVLRRDVRGAQPPPLYAALAA